MGVRRMSSGMLSALFLLGMLLLISTAAADTWECNFENPADADLWTPCDKAGGKVGEGEWEIKDGAYHQTVTDSLYHVALAGDPEWTNYTVEFDMTVLDGRPVAGVLLRSDETGGNGYRLIIHDKGAFAFGLWQDGTYLVSYAEVAAPALVGEEYHIKCSIDEWVFSVWVDDDQIIDYDLKDEERLFESGMVGLINYACHVSYDNITVTGPNVKSLLVEARGKHSTIWGQIKRDGPD